LIFYADKKSTILKPALSNKKLNSMTYYAPFLLVSPGF